MRKVAFGLAGALALGLCVPRVAGAVEIDSKALKITMTGRVQAMWTTSSVDSLFSNEFLVRRARLALRLKINDWVSGMIEPDFGTTDGKVDLKDCYVKFEPSEDFEVTLGQTKRRFDLFELTSSTQMLAIERDGRIGRFSVPTLSFLTEKLGYADRDIGLFVAGKLPGNRVKVEAAVTNGSGANKKAEYSERGYQARLTVEPLKDLPLALSGGVSLVPYREKPSNFARHARAMEAALEYGDFKSGPHLQTGLVWGRNWSADTKTIYNPGGSASSVDSLQQDFVAFQGIATYKKLLANSKWFEAIEPLLRVSWADPNTDGDNDGGILITPGVNLFVAGRTRVAANADIFLPEASDNPLKDSSGRPVKTVVDESATAYGIKVATWLYW